MTTSPVERSVLTMTQAPQTVGETVRADPMIRAAGGFAIASGIVSTAGVAFLITMFALFAARNTALGQTFGLLNDISAVVQYLLAIPIALALHRILLPYSNPALIRLATVVGIASMMWVVALQLALVFRVLTFEQQAGWVSLAIFVGVGSWLVITGLVARSTGRLPNSVVMSAVAVPYLGYPIWAFWLGRRLLSW
ncbi:MAG TPA: hypothetical protein VJK02_06820 [Anaerolineales bacterium]|nr:hypothetical protein [Anaerolineales bacterium]